MKKHFLFTLFAVLSLGVTSFAMATSHSFIREVNADQGLYSLNGYSGQLLFVNGSGTYFNPGDADLAIYCFNSESDYAWSDRVSYRISGDTIRVMVPYKNGASKTWSKFNVCRYNPSMNPASDGLSGVYNKTEDLYFSSFLYNQNTITINGYNGDKITVAELKGATNYYGVKGDTHMYLDLKDFTDWEKEYAKFAVYFAYPQRNDEKRWSLSNSSEGYYTAFCWKVKGQYDNDHLYECIVPNIDSKDNPTLWNMVIAVRFSPDKYSPDWDSFWNQTQDLKFTSSNNNANIISITDWGNGELNYTVSRESRVGFYGTYFNNTVACSDSGDYDATTSDMWNAVKDEYVNHLSLTFRGDVWKSIGDKEGTIIQQAMARYDYIVFYKKYDHVDFMNRKDSPNKTIYSSSLINSSISNDSPFALVAITVVAITSVTLIGLLVFIKTKKVKE